MNSILEIKNLYKNYQDINEDVNVLENINIKLNKGDFLGIIGPSGSGKSTLLSIISGLENKTSGSIIKDDNIICSGYVTFSKMNGATEYKAYLKCGDNYVTKGYNSKYDEPVKKKIRV